MKQRLSRHSTPSRTALIVGHCYFQFAEICVLFVFFLCSALTKIAFAAARLVIDVFILLVFCLVAQVTSEPESRNFFLRRDQDFGCWWATMAALGSVGRDLPSGRRIVFIFCLSFQTFSSWISAWPDFCFWLSRPGLRGYSYIANAQDELTWKKEKFSLKLIKSSLTSATASLRL